MERCQLILSQSKVILAMYSNQNTFYDSFTFVLVCKDIEPRNGRFLSGAVNCWSNLFNYVYVRHKLLNNLCIKTSGMSFLEKKFISEIPLLLIIVLPNFLSYWHHEIEHYQRVVPYLLRCMSLVISSKPLKTKTEEIHPKHRRIYKMCEIGCFFSFFYIIISLLLFLMYHKNPRLLRINEI